MAAVLNVTPNHLDRYESLTDYAAAKHRIFMNQTASDVAILNADDEIVSSWANGLRAHVTQFSVRRELEEGLCLRGRDLISRTNEREKVLMTRDDGCVRFTIRDQGRGFNWQRFIDIDPLRAFDNHGRGIAIARSFLNLEYLGSGTMSSLFSTHPPLEKRIQALREMNVTPHRS